MPIAALSKATTNALVKYALFVCTFLFWISSLVLIVVGAWALVTKELEGTRKISSAWDFIFDATIVFIVVGSVAFVIASAGCIGALRENVTYLKYFWISLLSITFVLIVLSIVGFAMWPYFLRLAKEKLSTKMVERYHDDPDLKDMIDFIQTNFKCCGLSEKGYHDWTKNIYFQCSLENVDPRRCGVPHSCCLPNIRFNDVTSKIYTTGCIGQVINDMKHNVLLICAIALGLALIPLFNICLAVTLIAQIREDSQNWYEYHSMSPSSLKYNVPQTRL